MPVRESTREIGRTIGGRDSRPEALARSSSLSGPAGSPRRLRSLTEADGAPQVLQDILSGDPPDQWTFLILPDTVQLINEYMHAVMNASKASAAFQEAAQGMTDLMDPETGLNSPHVANALQAAGRSV
jgi:hypothetical protein